MLTDLHLMFWFACLVAAVLIAQWKEKSGFIPGLLALLLGPVGVLYALWLPRPGVPLRDPLFEVAEMVNARNNKTP